MNTITQELTFTAVELSADQRRLTSSIPVEATRNEAEYVSLDIGTSHAAGQGYRVTVSRTFMNGPFKTLALNFGKDGDMQHLNMSANLPASTRFNKKALQTLHDAAIQEVENNIDPWIEWASLSKTSR